jgi:hypothetical protein
MPTWPSDLPAPNVNSFEESPPQTTLRTQMEIGPDKVRKRFSAGIRPVSFKLILTAVQVATLDTFYVTGTSGGALRFDYTHPRTSAAVKARFIDTPRYKSIDPSYYEADVKLEILPT